MSYNGLKSNVLCISDGDSDTLTYHRAQRRTLCLARRYAAVATRSVGSPHGRACSELDQIHPFGWITGGRLACKDGCDVLGVCGLQCGFRLPHWTVKDKIMSAFIQCRVESSDCQ
jgi:hypothetical protein